MLSERQEVLASLMEDRSRLQSKATEKYSETIFEERRELEGKKSKEALVRVQKSTFCHDVKVKGMERACCNVGEVESDKTLDWPLRHNVC